MVRTAVNSVKMGTVHTVPSRPNAISNGRRPTRSDSAPNTGCINTNAIRLTTDTIDASALLMPALLTRNFCM